MEDLYLDLLLALSRFSFVLCGVCCLSPEAYIPYGVGFRWGLVPFLHLRLLPSSRPAPLGKLSPVCFLLPQPWTPFVSILQKSVEKSLQVSANCPPGCWGSNLSSKPTPSLLQFLRLVVELLTCSRGLSISSHAVPQTSRCVCPNWKLPACLWVLGYLVCNPRSLKTCYGFVIYSAFLSSLW